MLYSIFYHLYYYCPQPARELLNCNLTEDSKYFGETGSAGGSTILQCVKYGHLNDRSEIGYKGSVVHGFSSFSSIRTLYFK